MKKVKKIKSLIIVLSILVFMFVAYFISSNFFEPKAYNWMMRTFVANQYGSDKIVIIAIDDKSVDQIRWPWKREIYSKIFEYLNDYSTARAIGFDAIITTPDKENPESDLKFYNSIKNMDKLIVGFSPLLTAYSSLEKGKAYNKKFEDKFAFNIEDKRYYKPLSYYLSLSMFPVEYFDSISKVGSIIATPDSDGYLRHIDQFVNYNGQLYPSLAMRIYTYISHQDKIIVNQNKILFPQTKTKIPVYSTSGGVYSGVKYYKHHSRTEYSHQKYSAIDIINSYDLMKQGKKPIISPQLFEDKIVFVGANAKTLTIGLEDAKPTPILEKHPGVDIQATNLDNIMHNEFMTKANGFLAFWVYVILLSVTFLAIRYFSLFASLGIVALSMITYFGLCVISYKHNIVISVITPLALQLTTMAIAYSYRFILEGQNKEKIKKAMGKFISHDVMQDVVKNIDQVKLGGKRANVTVLFADIRGFTSMSEKLSAEEVSVILNEYFTEIEPIISKHNGVINKFIGDAVMAIFGEPIQDKNHAENAVKCAHDMLKKVDVLQKKWIQEGKPKLEIGVGVNTGEAFVGNIGSEKRLEYTVIGDMVNLASRLESYNKVYKTRFLISASTYEKVRNLVDVIKISEVAIRGKAQKINIYEVLRVVK